MSPAPNARLQDFFDDYAAASLAGDGEVIANAYFSTYVASGPSGVEAWVVDADYRRKLVERSKAMQDLGLCGLEARVRQARTMAPGHFLVDVDWSMRFDQGGKSATISEFAQTYVARESEDRFQILCYVSHEDEEAVMTRDLGLPSRS